MITIQKSVTASDGGTANNPASPDLSGFVFEIKDSGSVVVDTLTTDGSGTAVSIALPDGDYTVVETDSQGLSDSTGSTAVALDTSGKTVNWENRQTAPNVDIEVTKNVSNSTPNDGDQVTYTIIVKNNGPDDATAIFVKDQLPTGATYDSDDGGDDYDSGTGIWDVGNLTSGSEATLVITVDVSGSAGDVVENIATLDSVTQADSDETNDSDSAIFTIARVDNSITKTVTNSNPFVDELITYTIVVTNNGPDNATGVVVTDLLPGGVTYISDDVSGAYVSDTGIWTVGSLASGAEATLEIIVRVTGTINVEITNTATVTEVDQVDTDDGNDSDTAVLTISPPTITVDKTARPTSVVVKAGGNVITFAVTVTNTSPVSLRLSSLEDDIHGDLNGQGDCSVPEDITSGGSYTCSFTATVMATRGTQRPIR